MSEKPWWIRDFSPIVYALCLGLCLVQPALAQRRGSQGIDPVVSKEAWVISYALVILFIGLGLFIISIPSRREKRVRKK